MDKTEADKRLEALINKRSETNLKIQQMHEYIGKIFNESDNEYIENSIAVLLNIMSAQLSTAVSSLECGCDSAKQVVPIEFLNRIKHLISLLEEAEKEAEEIETELQRYDL